MEPLVPHKIEDFKSKAYWDKFFEKRKGVPFEWYGEYKDIKDILAKEINPKHKILIAGCGNSLLGEQLYDNGFENIINVDFSEKVISEMEARKNKREKLKYEVMDLLDLKYPNDSFDSILDKSTLDAMFCNEDPSTISMVEKMWENCFRVLGNHGKYICITLLEQRILSKVFSYFLNGNHNPLYANNAFVMRIYEVQVSESKPGEEANLPFIFVIEKSKIDSSNPSAVKVKEMLANSVYYVSEKSEAANLSKVVENVRNRQMFGYVLQKGKNVWLFFLINFSLKKGRDSLLNAMIQAKIFKYQNTY